MERMIVLGQSCRWKTFKTAANIANFFYPAFEF